MSIGTILTFTFVLLILMWVLTKSQAFSAVVSTMGSAYTGSIKALLPQQTG